MLAIIEDVSRTEKGEGCRAAPDVQNSFEEHTSSRCFSSPHRNNMHCLQLIQFSVASTRMDVTLVAIEQLNFDLSFLVSDSEYFFVNMCEMFLKTM